MWSTRQLADLAGTTVKTVRHYHRMELLELPERAPNGYKRYRTTHLARLLQIKRLTELGLSLARIKAMGCGGEGSEDTIDVLDAELAAEIERLQGIREELATLREHRAPLDVPAPFGPVARGMSEQDRALLAVFSGTLREDALDDLRRLIAEPTENDVDEDFDRLCADADDEAIENLASRLAASIRRSHARFPWMAAPGSAGTRGRERAEAALGSAVAERFNAAQLKTLVRAHALVEAQS
ncbi:MerR family transcriptional regulator [Amycolatopsis sp. CA-128772]|uniref:MerR family transcriptional regulator n=1 Tax=Amycolatopsis sp. CA-128772 TaxID=2073159 RepID=UPI000CD0F407|nr:MerR family transcriptional regulator [Amycolatopsis sp. CA-128772]